MTRHARQLKTWWTTLPAGHHRHPNMLSLLEDHGAAGPHAFTVLLSEGASVPPSGDRGTVRMAWSDFARYAGTEDTEDAHKVMASLQDLGLIALEDDTPRGFRARLLKWDEWDLMPKDPGAAERKRQQRAREADNAVDATSQAESA